MTHYDNLILYYLSSCPYCRKVMRFMDQNDITLDTREIQDPENLHALVEIGGKKQVPCLIIDNEALYESDDIIKYLGNR